MLPLPAAAADVDTGGIPRLGRGSGDFWALAGTARGVSDVPVPVRGMVPEGLKGPEEDPGDDAVAIPGFGAGFRLIFSACKAAVAGAVTGATGRDFSSETINRSMVATNRSTFWERREAQSGSAADEDEEEVAGGEWEAAATLAVGWRVETGAVAGAGVVAVGLRVEKAIHSAPPSATTKVASVTVPAALRARRPAMAIGPAA